MQDPSEHARNRNAIESVLRYIPGFRGYLEKEYRRESDELARQWLADQLDRSKRTLAKLSRSLADAAQIDSLPQIDRLRARIDKLIARIRGAMQGYSGFFDLVRVDVDRLERIYAHDFGLADSAHALVQTVEGLPDRQNQLADALAEAHGQIDQFERQWDKREDMLRGLE